MKKLVKSLAVVMVAVFLFCSVQEGVWAAPFPVKSAIDNGARAQKIHNLSHDIEDEEHESPIMGEVEELRDETAKHFRKADGTFVAASYREPVHVRDEKGNWINIDATLSPEEIDGAAFFVAQALPNPVSFPESFSDGQQVSIEADGRKISFGVSDFNAIAVAEPEPENVRIEPSESKSETEEIQPTEASPTEAEPSTVEASSEALTQEAETTTESTTERTEEIESTTQESLNPAASNNEIEDAQQVVEAPVKSPVAIIRPAVNFNQKAKVIAVDDAFSSLAEEEVEIEKPIVEDLSEVEKIRQANAAFMEVEPSKSAIIYENMFDGADLEYIVTPTKVKESIVLKEKKEQYSYVFDMDFGGLLPVP